ncbi:GntR family transcriptional regulator [Clostridium vincentii]|uniref:Mannosyl-D-glycerate transport/metabolism system repressor MngR n=1 Tax=Clostridium vincentii TaxID=52704 RepID=A0A2T0BJK0_9CLOT|nr:GntR family transcriptional regulator [Clostridium vincentii]PRR84051.1 Mannosyl-D-glycerate transport/metabolism system repressor MngR [Clostridium vincentii]
MKSKEIIATLIEKITSGEIPVDSYMQSESQLSAKYECNRHTIRKVIGYLLERGYLIKDSHGSSYVNDFSSFDNDIFFLSSLSDFYTSESISSKIIKLNLIKASDKLTKTLKIEKAANVWSILRVRYIKNIPYHIEEIYMPYSLFPNLTRTDCEASLLSFIESQYDFKISHGIKNISAIKLTLEESKLLNLSGKPLVLQFENTGYLTNGRIYEYSISKSHENNIHYYSRR